MRTLSPNRLAFSALQEFGEIYLPDNLVTSENSHDFKVLKLKTLLSIIAIITEDKITEIFCTADDFRRFFDKQMLK